MAGPIRNINVGLILYKDVDAQLTTITPSSQYLSCHGVLYHPPHCFDDVAPRDVTITPEGSAPRGEVAILELLES